MPQANSNGIQLEYETFGDASGRPLILVMGLGAQMLLWDEGFCEALAVTSDGKLLGAIRGKGIFIHNRHWEKLLEAPIAEDKGEQWAYLAEYQGEVAYATSSSPHILDSSANTWRWSGTTGLWISSEGTLRSVKVQGAD